VALTVARTAVPTVALTARPETGAEHHA